MDAPGWPLPPIRPEDLPLIRGLLSPEDYRKLLQRMADDPATWLPPGYRDPGSVRSVRRSTPTPTS